MQALNWAEDFVSMDRRSISRTATATGDDVRLIGRSKAFQDTLARARLVAPIDIVVLLSGETGTGKTEIARYIHAKGLRPSGPFVEINCAALPDALFENEMFGAAAGAHSTARCATAGKIAVAEHGTLFLDEIGELSLIAQAKLLQFLDSGEYFPLGSPRSRRADTRVIAASNVDLQAAVSEGRFRSDLLYRLESFPVRVPSLSERVEDIPQLARHCCEMAIRRHKLRTISLADAAVEALVSRAWPGNIRQLKQSLTAAVIRANAAGAAVVAPEHLGFTADLRLTAAPQDLDFHGATRSFQAAFLREALETAGWNVSECARRVGLARSHAYTLIREFGLQRELGAVEDAATQTDSSRDRHRCRHETTRVLSGGGEDRTVRCGRPSGEALEAACCAAKDVGSRRREASRQGRPPVEWVSIPPSHLAVAR